MGIDGWNTLHIRGPREDLNKLEETGVVFSTNDKQLTYIAENYFGKNNIEICHKDTNYMVIKYDARNGIFYDYLQKILETYPKCWLKNEYSDENGNAGVWIARYIDGEINVQEHEWTELTIEELVHSKDFSLNSNI
jgi:hypothetical protein